MQGNFGLIRKWPLVFLFLVLFLGVMEARAEIQIWGDTLTMTGFLRYELAVHTSIKNENNNIVQKDNNWLNLSRAFFQTELTFRPTDFWKLYAKVRLTHDSTEYLDKNLASYNAFPLMTPNYGTYMRPDSGSHFAAEVWELYSDLRLGNLFLRAGRQQIVWGEMINTRIMDLINPLDRSWHFQFEPEEFENIRIPQWAVRANYQIPQRVLPWLTDLYVEGFLNPGDFSPNIDPDLGPLLNSSRLLPLSIGSRRSIEMVIYSTVSVSGIG